MSRLVSPSGRYYVQHTRTWSGDSAVWWRPERRGYTYSIEDAGIYDEAEARRIERIRGEERAIPVEVVEVATSRHVSGPSLERAIAAHVEAAS